MEIKSLSKRGRYTDGGGLYLQISKVGTKSWLFVYKRGAKPVSEVATADVIQILNPILGPSMYQQAANARDIGGLCRAQQRICPRYQAVRAYPCCDFSACN